MLSCWLACHQHWFRWFLRVPPLSCLHICGYMCLVCSHGTLEYSSVWHRQRLLVNLPCCHCLIGPAVGDFSWVDFYFVDPRTHFVLGDVAQLHWCATCVRSKDCPPVVPRWCSAHMEQWVDVCNAPVASCKTFLVSDFCVTKQKQ